MSTKTTNVESADEPTINHGDTIETAAEANAAVLEAGMVLRVQPAAPGATRYVYHDPRGAWLVETARVRGQQRWTATNAAEVRSIVSAPMERGNVMALDADEHSNEFGAWEIR